MSFADKVKSFFHHSRDKVDTDKVTAKATEAADAVKNKVGGDK